MMLATGRGHEGGQGGLKYLGKVRYCKATGSSLFRLHFMLVRVGSAPLHNAANTNFLIPHPRSAHGRLVAYWLIQLPPL